jgi:hypothetical protein
MTHPFVLLSIIIVTFVIKCAVHGGTPLDTFQRTNICLPEKKYFFLSLVLQNTENIPKRRVLYKRFCEIKSHRSVIECLGSSEDEGTKACYHIEHTSLPEVSFDT